MKSFEIAIEQQLIDRILQRVRDYAWQDEVVASGWSLGTDQTYMRALQDHWLNRFDWRAAERELNRFPQFIADVQGLPLHFIHEKSSEPGAAPLLLLHGWPGSTFEFQHLIEPLAHPRRFGMESVPAFDVVVATLPGYGFSGKPPAPIGPRRTAAYMNALMTDVLGYDRYFAQGGDWGAITTGWIGFDHADHCAAIHLNLIGLCPGGDVPGMLGSSAAPPETAEELAWAQDTGARLARDAAYAAIQSTRPKTLSYAMHDSPIGVAAWIAEKFQGWSDLAGQSLEEVHSFDRMLTNIMIYLVTSSFESAAWMYHGAAMEGITLPPGQRVEVPVAVAAVPADIFNPPPRSYVEKGYNIAQWTDFPRGGHFTALEVPDLLLADIRAFFATVPLTR